MTKPIQKQHDPRHPYKYYDLFGMLSVCVLMISNTVAPKMMAFGPFTFSAAIIIFPITYLISDIMTEVYGYARARRVTWAAIGGVVLMALMYKLTIILPHIEGWNDQEAVEKVLGATPRIVFASITAVFFGDILNCYVLAKMKVRTEGKHLWARFTLSTLVGEGLDSVIFFTVAFLGVLPTSVLMSALLSGWFFKTVYEVIMLPLTYKIVHALKRVEGVDFYDVHTNFTPFSLEIGEDSKK